MKKVSSLVIISLFLCFSISEAQPPKREVRGVWVASVVNLDWPSAPGLTVATQQTELVSLLDDLKEIGINTVIFQIRPECDALYDSPYEPWSYWLSAQQGVAPDPYYDPLEFAVSEAHKRGMELHAWFNPYRAERIVGNYPTASQHVTKQFPSWVIQIGTIKFLDPGLPPVRAHVVSVVLDVVNRYDVDGVHFDDYFYPYPPNQITNQDANTFANYNRGFVNLSDWRRDNVNLLVQTIHDSIQIVKPHVKFGISPFGIWRSGVPDGIVGLDAYNVIYCDALAWLSAQTIDYLTPQLYWAFGGGQDYGTLLPWWASYAGQNDRHLYPGQAAYRMSPSENNWPVTEMINQINLNRSTDDVYGSVFFRAKRGITDNIKGFADTLKNNFYKNPAIPPVLDWKETIPPNPPQNVLYGPLAERQPYLIIWDLPATAADGDSASNYALYRKPNEQLQPSDVDGSQFLYDIAGERYNSAPEPEETALSYSYAVTALDRNYNESGLSNIIQIFPPSSPLLSSPVNNAVNQPDTMLLTWAYVDSAAAYHLQVANDTNFTSVLIERNQVSDTTARIFGMDGQQNYYWRVCSSNPAGRSDFSEIFTFTTGFPGEAPMLVFPEDGSSDLPLDTILVWQSTPNATMYQVQLAQSELFTTNIVLDTVVAGDTTLYVNNLSPFVRLWYYWRVKALNEFGAGDWSDTWQFRTIISTIEPEQQIAYTYDLEQNYPNPFNPITTIQFSIAEPGFVSLRVFNILGQEVAAIVNDNLTAGRYTAEFDAARLSSGIYIYQLRTEGFIKNRKMMVIK